MKVRGKIIQHAQTPPGHNFYHRKQEKFIIPVLVISLTLSLRSFRKNNHLVARGESDLFQFVGVKMHAKTKRFIVPL